MRIWLQKHTVEGRSALLDKLYAEHVVAVAGPGTTIDIHTLPPDTYAAALPEPLVGYGEIGQLFADFFAASAVAAERQGYDAWISAAEQDPGLAVAAWRTGIPVVGYGQAAWQLARNGGYRLGVLGFVDALAEPIIGNICAAGADLVSYQVIAEGTALVEHALAQDFDPLVRAYTAAAARAAAAGAQWLVSAAGIPHEILVHLGVRELAGLPLIDPLGLAVATAEHLHRLRTLGIIARPEVGYARRPPRSLVEQADQELIVKAVAR
ncbi:aspartate/glutamate racemase family protein [Nonomuraea sp. SYSU D8015]|uniref:aspartate/glutamate racemase family protein n=1 Tax=Nonomuraea sp. SYSU D8015 TaxID=2593644 RepID=UPI0016604525|nr:aspartate/glutamate racemase family protein [Nonomuraea sp. SYSU D8015]